MSNPKEETILKVSFPNEKLEALRFYMAEKELTVEGELQKFVDNIYQKYIPAPTRRYLDRDDKNEEGIQAKAIDTSQKTTVRKRTVKAKDTVKEEGNSAAKTETIEEATEQNQEESQGMTMTM